MAQSTKGFRPIQVDGQFYHWAIRDEVQIGLELMVRAWPQGKTQLYVTFAREKLLPGEDWGLIRTPGLEGSRLVQKDGFYQGWDQHRGFYLEPVPMITPRVVAEAIRQGLAAGWRPDDRDGARRLALSAPSTMRAQK
jgi:hypothetical protein